MTSDFGAADLKLVGLYLLGDVLLYAATALIGIWPFRLDFRNAIALSILWSFVLSVLAIPVLLAL